MSTGGNKRKILVLGIDGGEREVLKRLELPFLSKLFAENETLDIKEDLFSRGWAEMYTGQHAHETGAFYLRPLLNGTRSFNKSFGYTEASFDPEQFLWRVAERRGHKVGWVNVPTVSPSDKIDGFFIGGSPGGGGKSDIGREFDDNQAFPKEVCDYLRSIGYIADIRVLPTSKFDGIAGFFEVLKEMVGKQVEAFLKYSSECDVTFGFFAIRAVVAVQNIAMSEIKASFFNDPGHDWESPWKSHLHDFFLFIDDAVRRVFEAFEPDHFIITSDHGTVSYENRIDLNKFLQGHNWQPLSIDLNRTLKNALKKALPFIPRFKRWMPTEVVSKQVDFANTTAFTPEWYVAGVFVNDTRRFGGPVQEERTTAIATEVCDAINGDAEAKRSGVSARLYRSNYADAKFYDSLPDVWVDKPDGMFPFESPSFIVDNPQYGPVPSPSGLPGSLNAGVKGSVPLFTCDKASAALVEPDDPRDLRLVYRIVERLL